LKSDVVGDKGLNNFADLVILLVGSDVEIDVVDDEVGDDGWISLDVVVDLDLEIVT
jgi:hypothetical protein